jgi:mono/diheme cytochrome c family protein
MLAFCGAIILLAGREKWFKPSARRRHPTNSHNSLQSEGPMSRKYGIATLLLAGFFGTAAYYGGWAVTSVENLPDQLVAGTPYNLTFAVRQHGVEPLDDLSPYVELRSGRRELVARAVRTNKPGFYTATLNVPAAGDWSATIQTSFGRSHIKLLPIPAVAKGARTAANYTQPQRGQRLFAAKGCVVCHQHAKVDGAGMIDFGPDLTDKRFNSAYLRQFLADPSIKPPTDNKRMPNMNLNEREIAALAAFINGETGARAATR